MSQTSESKVAGIWRPGSIGSTDGEHCVRMKGDDGEWLYDTDYWHEGTDFWDNYNEHEDPTFEWLDDSPEAIAEASQEERVKELEILLKREQIQCRIYRKTLEENGFVMLKEGTPGNGRFA